MIERFGFLISCLLVRCGDLASPYLDGRSAIPVLLLLLAVRFGVFVRSCYNLATILAT
jgi:hypothetical protein